MDTRMMMMMMPQHFFSFSARDARCRHYAWVTWYHFSVLLFSVTHIASCSLHTTRRHVTAAASLSLSLVILIFCSSVSAIIFWADLGWANKKANVRHGWGRGHFQETKADAWHFAFLFCMELFYKILFLSVMCDKYFSLCARRLCVRIYRERKREDNHQ